MYHGRFIVIPKGRGGVSKPETVITVKKKKVNETPKGPMPDIAFTKNNIIDWQISHGSMPGKHVLQSLKVELSK